jgi:hypothetical protein
MLHMQVPRTSQAWAAVQEDVVALCARNTTSCTVHACTPSMPEWGSPLCRRIDAATADTLGLAAALWPDAEDMRVLFIVRSRPHAFGSCAPDAMRAAAEAGETWWLQCRNARAVAGESAPETAYEAAAALQRTGALDARPEHSVVCFSASDGFLDAPIKCVHIEFVRPGVVRWMDDRNWDAECLGGHEMPSWAAGDTFPNGTEFWVAPGSTLQVELSAYGNTGGPLTIQQVRLLAASSLPRMLLTPPSH